jgi:glycine hydroxymethyltransferase
MANAFVERGYKIISGGTDNHLMLIDLRTKNITGKIAENTLIKSDITINKNMVPFDDKSPFVTSGMRIGTAAITSRGFGAEDCLKTVDWIDKILSDHENENLQKEVKKEINKYMEGFPLYT